MITMPEPPEPPNVAVELYPNPPPPPPPVLVVPYVPFTLGEFEPSPPPA